MGIPKVPSSLLIGISVLKFFILVLRAFGSTSSLQSVKARLAEVYVCFSCYLLNIIPQGYPYQKMLRR